LKGGKSQEKQGSLGRKRGTSCFFGERLYAEEKAGKAVFLQNRKTKKRIKKKKNKKKNQQKKKTKKI